MNNNYNKLHTNFSDDYCISIILNMFSIYFKVGHKYITLIERNNQIYDYLIHSSPPPKLDLDRSVRFDRIRLKFHSIVLLLLIARFIYDKNK